MQLHILKVGSTQRDCRAQLPYHHPCCCYCCAQVYLSELAPKHRQGLVGALGFVAAMTGCGLGVVMVMIVEAGTNDGAHAAIGSCVLRAAFTLYMLPCRCFSRS